MKFLTIGFVVGLLMFPLPLMACRGVSEESTIFFNKNPKFDKNSRFNIIPKIPQAQATIKIQIKSVKGDLTLAEVLHVPKSKKLPIKVGSIIALEYAKTSCTQFAAVGETGTIVIKGFVNSDDLTQLKAYVYQRRYRDGRLQ